MDTFELLGSYKEKASSVAGIAAEKLVCRSFNESLGETDGSCDYSIEELNHWRTTLLRLVEELFGFTNSAKGQAGLLAIMAEIRNSIPACKKDARKESLRLLKGALLSTEGTESVESDEFKNVRARLSKTCNANEDFSRERLLESANFGNVQPALLEASGSVADSIITKYIRLVDAIFDAKDFSELKPNYQLNADQKASQRSKISAIVKSNFGQVISDAREIEALRAWLKSNHSAYKSATSDDLDVGHLARTIGAGALTLANPVIGIASLIGNWAAGSEKKKNIQAQADVWSNKFAEFEGKISILQKSVLDAAAKTKSYVTEKSKEVNGDALIEVAKHLKKLGHDLSHLDGLLVNEISELDQFILENTQGA